MSFFDDAFPLPSEEDAFQWAERMFHANDPPWTSQPCLPSDPMEFEFEHVSGFTVDMKSFGTEPTSHFLFQSHPKNLRSSSEMDIDLFLQSQTQNQVPASAGASQDILTDISTYMAADYLPHKQLSHPIAFNNFTIDPQHINLASTGCTDLYKGALSPFYSEALLSPSVYQIVDTNPLENLCPRLQEINLVENPVQSIASISPVPPISSLDATFALPLGPPMAYQSFESFTKPITLPISMHCEDNTPQSLPNKSLVTRRRKDTLVLTEVKQKHAASSHVAPSQRKEKPWHTSSSNLTFRIAKPQYTKRTEQQKANKALITKVGPCVSCFKSKTRCSYNSYDPTAPCNRCKIRWKPSLLIDLPPCIRIFINTKLLELKVNLEPRQSTQNTPIYIYMYLIYEQLRFGCFIDKTFGKLGYFGDINVHVIRRYCSSFATNNLQPVKIVDQSTSTILYIIILALTDYQQINNDIRRLISGRLAEEKAWSFLQDVQELKCIIDLLESRYMVMGGVNYGFGDLLYQERSDIRDLLDEDGIQYPKLDDCHLLIRNHIFPQLSAIESLIKAYYGPPHLSLPN